jgi:integrase
LARGNITRRGRRSWRLKFELPRGDDGKRQYRVVTVRGTKREADAALAKLITEVNTGAFVDPSKLKTGEWLRAWLAGLKLTPRSRETYEDIVDRLDRAIGSIPLQKLRPVHVRQMKFTKRDGAPVAEGTARQARRVLKAALHHAMDNELVSKNVAASGSRVAAEEDVAEVPGQEDIAGILEAVCESDIYPIVHLAVSTGARRGELLALRWVDVDLDARTIRIERTLEYTKAHGARFKSTKTKAGRRTIEIPIEAVDVLRAHRAKQLELRMALGMGKPRSDALVFCRHDGKPLSGDRVTLLWREAVDGRWKFHALRHAHASALISAGLDIVSVSRRLGHSGPDITLRIYAHKFTETDRAAADAIGKVLGTNRVPSKGGKR